MTPKALLNIPYRQWSTKCQKWSYPTKEIALKYLRDTRARRIREGCTGKMERDVYRCKDCPMFHLTSQVRRVG